MTPEEFQATLDAHQAELDARVVREREGAFTHVREPQPRRRTGNQFYKNRGFHEATPAPAICGGQITTYDLDWQMARTSLRTGQLDQHLKCPDCRARVRSAPR